MSSPPPPPPPTSPDPSKHPLDYLAPVALIPLIHAVECCIIVSQLLTYWSPGRNQGIYTRIILIFTSLVGFVQVILAMINVWRIMVTGFGDWDVVLADPWPSKMQPLLTALIAAPIQAFLTWRCWTLTQRRVMTLVVLCPLVLAYVVATLIVIANLFNPPKPPKGPVHIMAAVVPQPSRDIRLILTLAIPAVTDMILTSILIFQLGRSRSIVATPRLRKVLGLLILVTWEAAVPPCACAITCLVLFLASRQQSMWFPELFSVLGKLYVISLLTTLNARTSFPDLEESTTDWRTPVRTRNGGTCHVCRCQCSHSGVINDSERMPVEFARMTRTSDMGEISSGTHSGSDNMAWTTSKQSG